MSSVSNLSLHHTSCEIIECVCLWIHEAEKGEQYEAMMVGVEVTRAGRTFTSGNTNKTTSSCCPSKWPNPGSYISSTPHII